MKRRLLREIEADPDCGGTLLSVTRMSIYIGFIFVFDGVVGSLSTYGLAFR